MGFNCSEAKSQRIDNSVVVHALELAIKRDLVTYRAVYEV